MVMKKIFYLLSICALITMPFAFTSCSDDDDKDPTAPAKAVSNLSFTDTDEAEAKIGGTFTWTLPDSETDIDNYIIYLGGGSSDKGTKLGEVGKGTKSFDIPAGTAYQTHLLVVAKNAVGESTNIAALAIEDKVEGAAVVTERGFYILNGGNWNENNASLSYYNLTTGEMTADVYKTKNGKGLGDGAEQLIVYGSKMYITVSGSNRLVVLDMDGKELKSITPEGGEPMNPRCMAAGNGKVYVSYFYGHSVAMLDTASLSIEKEVKVGRYPEQLTVTNGKIYVANSGGNDHPNYGKTVSVIDQNSFAVEKEIEVAFNPVGITSDSQGDVYVISWADHGKTTDQALQRIDSKTGEVSTIGKATKMSIIHDKIYTYFSQYYNSSGISYIEYDALTEKVVNDKFIADNTIVQSPNAITVDPVSQNIFVTYFDYASTSTMYIFTADGKLQETIDTGGYDAKWMTFVTK